MHMIFKTLSATVTAFSLVATSQASAIFDTLSIPTSGQASNLGQSFKTGVLGSNSTLSNIVFKSAHDTRDGKENFKLTLRIYEDTSGDENDWNQGSLLASSKQQTIVGGSSTLYSFEFGSLKLKDNTVYLVEFDAASDSTIRVGFTGSNTDSRGAAFRNTTTTPSLLTDSDFAIQVNTAATAAKAPLAALVSIGGITISLDSKR